MKEDVTYDYIAEYQWIYGNVKNNKIKLLLIDKDLKIKTLNKLIDNQIKEIIRLNDEINILKERKNESKR